MSIKDILSPFLAWKNLVKEPVTIKKPLERKGAPRYRGFHINDIHDCIGCGSCETICQNAAIDMVPVENVEGVETKEGDSGLRPKVDYGRCCWCALCVDVCTTNSLNMTNEFTWNETDPEKFRYIPGVDKKSWDNIELGYRKDPGCNLNVPSRINMEELEPSVRAKNFEEIVQGYSIEDAQCEADRCVECGICQATCPAHMNIPDYIAAVRKNDLEEALRIVYKTNPLPMTCGRVCTHKCESICAMNHKGDPVAIRWIKRYIADQIPIEKYKKILGHTDIKKNGKKIAVIGAGPAGLSAAYYLVLQGYKVKIFESLDKAGGMTRFGIPEYRLPYDELDKDIEYIKSLGVEIKYKTTVGKDIALSKLNTDYDAVFAATGLHLGRSTNIPGTDHKRVYQAIFLLREFTEGKKIDVAEKIVVIGGGNVAMDIARTLARLQNQKFNKVNLTVTCLETEAIMPADLEEIVEGREEGITIEPGYGPQEIKIENNEIKGLSVVKCLSILDECGRFSPLFDENEKKFFEADMVVESIGQGMAIDYIDDFKDSVRFDGKGRVIVNRQTLQSDLPWLFVGGDIVEGPDVITGIANGQRAATGIDKYLSSKE